MNERIVELIENQNSHRGLLWTEEDKEEFAALVAAAEREACAKACEARKIIDPEYEYDRHYNQGAEHCAFAIRARGET